MAFTPACADAAELTVVIDVLRATTTIVGALDAGYERVLCADSIDRARHLAGPGRILAGEVRCLKPEGFDLGNSPAQLEPPLGSELVLATTNGAPAIVAAAAWSGSVLIGCLRNLGALMEAITDAGSEVDVLLLCSGTNGAPALEDVYVAGRIVERLDRTLTDAARVAREVARSFTHARDALAAGANAGVLRASGFESDIDWCARESESSVVPCLEACTQGVAAVVGQAIDRSHSMTMNI